jgi:cytochrome c peroxidase
VRLALATLAAVVGGATPGVPQDADPFGRAVTAAPSTEPVTPLPAAASGLDPARVRLGERLFQDAGLSRDGTSSCASCHDLERGGEDDRARSAGADGRPLDYNAPTVFNAALNFRLNWRGNFRTLEEQAEAMLLDPRLMGASWEEVLGRLRADPAYRDAFAAAYGGGPEPWQASTRSQPSSVPCSPPARASTAGCAASAAR